MMTECSNLIQCNETQVYKSGKMIPDVMMKNLSWLESTCQVFTKRARDTSRNAHEILEMHLSGKKVIKVEVDWETKRTTGFPQCLEKEVVSLLRIHFHDFVSRSHKRVGERKVLSRLSWRMTTHRNSCSSSKPSSLSDPSWSFVISLLKVYEMPFRVIGNTCIYHPMVSSPILCRYFEIHAVADAKRVVGKVNVHLTLVINWDVERETPFWYRDSRVDSQDTHPWDKQNPEWFSEHGLLCRGQ
jgi:hypothetical protein